MNSQTIDILGLLGGIRRRLPLVFVVALCGVLLSGAIAYLLPPVYQSTARILVESQQIPDDLARSTVTASAAERLQLIEQRLMTRENLLSVAARLDLFLERELGG